MNFKNNRISKLFGFSAALLLATVGHTSLPNEYQARVLATDMFLDSSLDLDAGARIPNRSAAQKALTSLGINEQLEFAPKIGGYGRAYMSPTKVVKVSLTETCTPAEETQKLIAVKRSVTERPLAGFSTCLPNVFFVPTTNQFHLHVMNRVAAVKDMMAIVDGAFVNNNSEDLKMIYALGVRLSQMQAASLSMRNGRRVCDAHLDLKPDNIIPTKLSEYGVPGTFTLLDCSDIRRGNAADAVSIVTDTVYFTIKSAALGIINERFLSLPETQQERNASAYVVHLYQGYLSEFPDNVRKELRPILTTAQSLNLFVADSIYLALVDGNQGLTDPNSDIHGWYMRYVTTAINAAFQSYEIPAQVPLIPADFQFDAYINANPADLPAAFGIIKNAKQREITAKNHFRDNGKRENRKYLPVQANFNHDAYLRLNPDLTAATNTYLSARDKKAWAEGHFYYRGKYEPRLFMDVPAGFDPIRYINLFPDLINHTATMTPVQKRNFGQEHYLNNGRAEGRRYQ